MVLGKDDGEEFTRPPTETLIPEALEWEGWRLLGGLWSAMDCKTHNLGEETSVNRTFSAGR